MTEADPERRWDSAYLTDCVTAISAKLGVIVSDRVSQSPWLWQRQRIIGGGTR